MKLNSSTQRGKRDKYKVRWGGKREGERENFYNICLASLSLNPVYMKYFLSNHFYGNNYPGFHKEERHS
jgi:hypothetical protein